jgi:hypothetical protein
MALSGARRIERVVLGDQVYEALKERISIKPLRQARS